MSQSLARILVHIIFSTKKRIKYLSPDIREQLYPYMATCLKNSGCHAHVIGGIEDHVHILCEISKNDPACKIIEKMKTSSSILVKKIADDSKDFHWQNGYGIFSVSLSNLESVVNYINNQTEHHKKISFQDELKLFLAKNKINYDEKYFWD